MLDLNHVSKTFNPGTVNEKVALQAVDLHLEAGDFATIVGSNGAGKSTLFNAIAGEFIADAGTITLDGQDITFLPDYRRSKVIGRMFQDPLKGTAPHMTIEENLALAFLRASRQTSPFSRITKADRTFFAGKLSALGLGLEDRMKQPVGLRRWADWGTLENNRYIPVRQSADMDAWKKLGEIPTAWLPARVRPMDKEHAQWDNYATQEDIIEFMKPFRDSIWHRNDARFVIKSGFAMPGMDNRGCAGWGRGHFFYMPRNNGETYKSMWEFCMADKDSLDMMFIASWSDYTEGHEIEPTLENGDRELRTTLHYAAEFKGEQADERGLGLPLTLFRLRKEAAFLEACRMDVSVLKESLDKAAMLISQGRYPVAYGLLSKLAGDVASAKSVLNTRMMRLRASDLEIKGKNKGAEYNPEETVTIKLPKQLVSDLQMNNHEGYIYFEYLDKGKETLFVRSATKREPKNLFNTVARIRTDNTGEWKQAKIRLYKENISYMLNSPTFYLKGNVIIRNLSLGYNIYTVK